MVLSALRRREWYRTHRPSVGIVYIVLSIQVSIVGRLPSISRYLQQRRTTTSALQSFGLQSFQYVQYLPDKCYFSSGRFLNRVPKVRITAWEFVYITSEMHYIRVGEVSAANYYKRKDMSKTFIGRRLNRACSYCNASSGHQSDSVYDGSLCWLIRFFVRS